MLNSTRNFFVQNTNDRNDDCAFNFFYVVIIHLCFVPSHKI